MSTTILKAAQAALEHEVRVAGQALQVFPKARDGRVIDRTAAYLEAKRTYDRAFQVLRAFNALHAATIRKATKD